MKNVDIVGAGRGTLSLYEKRKRESRWGQQMDYLIRQKVEQTFFFGMYRFDVTYIVVEIAKERPSMVYVGRYRDNRELYLQNPDKVS